MRFPLFLIAVAVWVNQSGTYSEVYVEFSTILFIFAAILFAIMDMYELFKD